jgi:hypothetical protein
MRRASRCMNNRPPVLRLLVACVIAGGCAVHATPPVSAAGAPPTAAAEGFQLDTNARWVRVLMAWSDESARAWSNDSLRTVLLGMAQMDQESRRGLTPERIADTAYVHHMNRVDSANARRMRGIIARFGWPTKSIVGARGASAAWLIVQHSAELQEEGERLMLAAKPGEVSPADLALLIDRRLVSQERPQRFGSQLKPFENGTTSFYPIEDAAGVDERRAAAGLPPLAEYIRMIEGMYHVKVNAPGSAMPVTPAR